MSILTVLQNVNNELSLVPSGINTAVTNSDRIVKQLLQIAKRTCWDIATENKWVELEKKTTITLVASQETYALAYDFDRFVTETLWDNTEDRPLAGPMSAQEYEERKEGIGTATPYRRFRIANYTSKQFYVDPIPTTADVLSYRYYTANIILPQVWAASTAYGAGAYVSYEGNIYVNNGSADTSGATPPTHTSGTASDDTITWTYYSTAPYRSFLADTDFFPIDETVLELGVMANFLYNKGLQNNKYMAMYQNAVRRRRGAKRGARTLSFVPSKGLPFLSDRNLPDTGYGS